MKKLLMVVLGIGLAQAEALTLTVPKKKRVSAGQLQEEIAECYGRIIQQQSAVIAHLSSTNAHLVNRTRELFEGSCRASVSQLTDHKDKLLNFEKELETFAARSCMVRDCVKNSLE